MSHFLLSFLFFLLLPTTTVEFLRKTTTSKYQAVADIPISKTPVTTTKHPIPKTTDTSTKHQATFKITIPKTPGTPSKHQ